MKKLFAAALLSTFCLAGTAQAQSSFVMVIGKRDVAAERTATALTIDQRVEMAAEDACERPFIRDLKGQRLHAECMTLARAEAYAQVAARTETARLSLR